MRAESETPLRFTREEILSALKSCNFDRAIGDDGFDGRILGQSGELQDKVAEDPASLIRQSELPRYLNEGRLVPLSKKKGHDVVAVDDIRPSVIKSYLTKVLEKAILHKVKDGRGHLLASGAYQTGFKEGKCTFIHLAEVAERLAYQTRNKSRRR
jgi:hypothetical protein